MKYIYILLLLSSTVYASEKTNIQTKYMPHIIPEKMDIATKKKRFYHLLVPAVKKVYKELYEQYLSVSKDIKEKKDPKNIERLKEIYKADSDEELLLALKPHKPSIALAQAVMESSWATSRFFVEANNTFGLWSYDKNEARIAAKEKRGGIKTVWLKKFDSIEESVREYYRLLGRGYAYKEFRKLRYESDDVYEIVKKLNRYSEMNKEYAKELSHIIRYNKLTKYD